MPRNLRTPWRVLFLALAWVCAGRLAAQEVVDRIVARVENDVILLSDLKELKEYQELVDGQSEADNVLLDRLVDQWVVRSEADLSRFPQPTDAEIDRGVARVEKSFGAPEEFERRKKQAGLSDVEVRKMVAGQLYLSNYLDSRFRPSAQINDSAVADFYKNAVVPRAKARGQEPPTLEASRDIIQEALIEKDINEQADRWLKESRSRLHVEKYLDEGAK
jgi:parvulin-like peptidyl-prolyl isomerase